jgi:hypothetical protein
MTEPNPPSASRPGRDGRLGSRLELVAVGAAWLLVVWFYLFTARSSGDWRRDAPFDYYNLLADGFAAGQLHLPVEPDPRLLALPDPYDPATNHSVRLPDATFFQGRYYLYFGPTPALLLLLPYRWLTGEVLPQAAAVWVFCVVGFTAGSGWWLAVRRRYFGNSRRWLAPLGVLLFGFGTHVLALVRRPELWELPIATSFALVMLALGALYRALHGARPILWTAVAGVLLGLAVGARPPALLATAALAPVLLGARRHGRPWMKMAGAAGGTLAAIGLGLAWYNHARFGSPFEFGQTYQLTGMKESEMRHFSGDYVLHNLRLYYTWLADWTRQWPFISSRPFPPGPPGYYGGEELYALLAYFPSLWFALAAAWGAVRGRGERIRCSLLVLAVGLVYVAQGAFMLCFFSATERYQVDFVPALMLLALLGMLFVEERLGGRARAIVLGIPALITIGFGILISFDYDRRSMRQTDPRTWRAIAETIDGWVDRLVEPPGSAAREISFPLPADRGDGPRPLRRIDTPSGFESVWVETRADGHLRVGWSETDREIAWSEWSPPQKGPQRLKFSSPAVARRERKSGGDSDWRARAVVLQLNGSPALAGVFPSGGARKTQAEGAEFPGVVVSDEATELDVRAELRGRYAGWSVRGPAPTGAGEAVELARTGPGDTLILESLGGGRGRLSWRGGGRSASSDSFALPAGPCAVEIEHGPWWPAQARTVATARAAVWVNGTMVDAFLLPAGFPGADALTLPVAAGWARAAAPAPAPPRRAVRLRAVLPDATERGPEPIAVWGRASDGGLVGWRCLGGGRAEFFIDVWGAPLRVGTPVALAPDGVIAITLRWEQIAGASHLAVDVDGQEVVRSAALPRPLDPETLAYGRNDIGASTAGERFSGWIFDVRGW